MTNKLILTALILVAVSPLRAQPGNPGDPDAPISGIEVLLASGITIGIKKIIDLRKTRNNTGI